MRNFSRICGETGVVDNDGVVITVLDRSVVLSGLLCRIFCCSRLHQALFASMPEHGDTSERVVDCQGEDYFSAPVCCREA